MPSRHEAHKPKIPYLHFSPEGYVSSSDEEYLDQLLVLLKSRGFDKDQLVFSGFNGQSVIDGGEPPQHNAIYVMDESRWRELAKFHEGTGVNSAEYAERWSGRGAPALGLYDKSLLREAYSHRTPEHPENQIPDIDISKQITFEGLRLQIPDDQANPDLDYRHTEPSYDEYIEEREEFADIVPGELLNDLPTDKPMETAVIHKDYPNASPAEALIGIVFLDE